MIEYSIKQIKSIDDIDGELASFFEAEADHLVALYSNYGYAPKSFDFLLYARLANLWVCYRGSRPVGVLLSRFYKSVFDSKTRILFQDLLYVKSGNRGAAHFLMRHFIDFGKVHADHIFTCIAGRTNIKGRSLEKLGFKKSEEIYRFGV